MKDKLLVAVMGVITGISLTVACGSVSPTIAGIIAKASEVSYDNSVTKISATTVQEVVDLFVAEFQKKGYTFTDTEQTPSTGTPASTPSSTCEAEGTIDYLDEATSTYYKCPCPFIEFNDMCTKVE